MMTEQQIAHIKPAIAPAVLMFKQQLSAKQTRHSMLPNVQPDLMFKQQLIAQQTPHETLLNVHADLMFKQQLIALQTPHNTVASEQRLPPPLHLLRNSNRIGQTVEFRRNSTQSMTLFDSKTSLP
jgi:hypothetical protein